MCVSRWLAALSQGALCQDETDLRAVAPWFALKGLPVPAAAAPAPPGGLEHSDGRAKSRFLRGFWARFVPE